MGFEGNISIKMDGYFSKGSKSRTDTLGLDEGEFAETSSSNDHFANHLVLIRHALRLLLIAQTVAPLNRESYTVVLSLGATFSQSVCLVRTGLNKCGRIYLIYQNLQLEFLRFS